MYIYIYTYMYIYIYIYIYTHVEPAQELGTRRQHPPLHLATPARLGGF